jgi:hypothetical protein
MGVYSTMRTDAAIMRDIAGLKSVVILGCSSCANTSIAYDKELPVNRIVIDNSTGRTKTTPVAIVEEENRLKALLESEGIKTGCEVFSAPCVLSDDIARDQAELLNRCDKAEAIITLFCPSGILGLKKLLHENIKIVPGMKTRGLWQRYTITDRETGLMYIDKSRFTIIRNG